MAIKLRTLRDEAPAVFSGRKVLLRLDLNLPLGGGAVADDYRLRRSLPTLKFLQQSRARVLVLSHLTLHQASLRPIAAHLNKLMPVTFAISLAEVEKFFAKAAAGSIMVLENLRRDPGEEGNSAEFASRLAKLGDIFVNDAFSVSHRRHASIVSLPSLLPSYAGLLFEEEINALARLFEPAAPFVVVLGGVKFATKLPLIERFLAIADKIFIGGALAHPFFKESGYEIGRSVVDETTGVVGPLLHNEKIVVPEDVCVEDGRHRISVKRATRVLPGDKIVDCAPEFLRKIETAAALAKMFLWNGPLGNFEAGFVGGTEKAGQIISRSQAFSVVGGGDTVAVIAKLNLLEKFGFVSTAGGAMLDFLATGTLPGIEALAASQN